jgi:hypothetical protein
VHRSQRIAAKKYHLKKQKKRKKPKAMTHETTPDVMADDTMTAVFSCLTNWYPAGGHGMNVSMQMTEESAVVVLPFAVLPNPLLSAVQIQQREETIGRSLILRHKGGNGSNLDNTHRDQTLGSKSSTTPPVDLDNTTLGGQGDHMVHDPSHRQY